MNGVASFFIIVIIIILLGAICYIVFTHLRARRLGLPPPAISSYNPFASSNYGGGGVGGFFNSKISAFKNRNNRSQTGGYEEPLSSNVRGRGARGFGPLDPDDAWDARVGSEADAYGPYEEEHLAHDDGGYHNVGAASAPGYNSERMPEPEPYIGGSQAGLDRRYDEEMGRVPSRNPFGDEAEQSNLGGSSRMRGISPRPIDTGHRAEVNLEDSPTESRKSMFHENV